MAMPTTAPMTEAIRMIGHQRLPAEPGAERGEQLEVAVAHAFLAGEQLEGLVDHPKRQVARHRAPHARGVRGTSVQRSAAAIRPAHSSGRVMSSGSSVVSQSIMASATMAAENTHQAAPAGVAPQCQHAEEEERAGGQFDQRIAQADGRAAGRALAAQRQVAEDRDVFVPADHVAALPAARARPHQVERRRLPPAACPPAPRTRPPTARSIIFGRR